MISPEMSQAIQTEVKQFATTLNLSDDQKAQLKTALENARDRIEQMREQQQLKQADMIHKVKEARTQVRSRIENFLTPDQLQKWDAEVQKAKTFMGISA